MAKRRVFWDAGGTLVKVNFDLMLESAARLFGIDTAELIEFIAYEEDPSVWRQFETEDLSAEKIHARFCERFKKMVPLEDFIQAFNNYSDGYDRYRLFPILKKLKAAGVELAIISNINRVHAEHFEATFPELLRFFPQNRRFYSYKLGLRKSEDPEIFHRILTLCGADPEFSVLVDDHPENITGFVKTGGIGIHFQGFHHLGYSLIEHGFLPY